MINVVSKINGVSNVKSIDSIKPEGIVLNPSVLNKIKEYVDGNTDRGGNDCRVGGCRDPHCDGTT